MDALIRIRRVARAALASLVVAGSFLPASCGLEPERETAASAAAAVQAAYPAGRRADSANAAVKQPEERPATIYYDLTRFDWYARGEPIQLTDGAYAPRGAPIRAETASMRKAGEYQGVDFYVSEENGDSSKPAVYVPVFEGFWLPFVRLAEEQQ